MYIYLLTGSCISVEYSKEWIHGAEENKTSIRSIRQEGRSTDSDIDASGRPTFGSRMTPAPQVAPKETRSGARARRLIVRRHLFLACRSGTARGRPGHTSSGSGRWNRRRCRLSLCRVARKPELITFRERLGRQAPGYARGRRAMSAARNASTSASHPELRVGMGATLALGQLARTPLAVDTSRAWRAEDVEALLALVDNLLIVGDFAHVRPVIIHSHVANQKHATALQVPGKGTIDCVRDEQAAPKKSNKEINE